ncbi:hypothetical protein SBA2_270074 [Acidobacteriia bacterium SbA2]|nr:hypothetical protein SBA2_270074 [Acidobacteriia bacterium SbA2]
MGVRKPCGFHAPGRWSLARVAHHTCRLTSGMAGLAPEVGEEVFRGLPGQLQIDSIRTQLDLIIPSDLPGGADVDLCKELLILTRLEDALPRQLRQVHAAFRAIREDDLDSQVRQRAYRNRFHHTWPLALASHYCIKQRRKVG